MTACRLAVSLLLAAFFGTAVAASDIHDCKRVKITIRNESGRAVQVFDLEYYDIAAASWRSETTPKRNLNQGAVWQEQRTLDDVNNAATKLRVRYRMLTANHLWEGSYKDYSAPVRCSDGQRITLTID